jgi:purine-cytosine permease-like protein
MATSPPPETGRSNESLVQVAEEDVEESFQHDFSTSETGIVPLNRRRPLWHFGGLWLTFQSGFSFLFVGFTLHNAGYRLLATFGIVLLAAAVYTVYGTFAAYLGSRTGQTHSLLSRSIFGRSGSGLVCIFLILGPIGWVGYQANLLAQIWDGLYGWRAVTAIGIVLAVLMIFNNLFGFTGISAIARYIITPLMFLWVVYLVIKGLTEGSGFLGATPKDIAPTGFWLALGTVIGFAIWGNEPDLFRYGKPKLWWPVPAYVFGFTFGLLLFGVGGWMVAQVSDNADFGPAVHATTVFSLFGLFWLAWILALAGQVAVNDGNYYEGINAVQNLIGGWRRWRRVYTCLVVAAIGGLAAWIVPDVLTNGFMKLASFQAITLPCATIIMATDHFVIPRLFRVSRPLTKVPSWAETAVINWPGVVALIGAVLFGAAGSGLIGSSSTYWYFDIGETWVLAAVLYIVGVWISMHLGGDIKKILGFSETALETPAEPGQILDVATQGGV